MAISFEGKSPGRLWYAWQYTKGLARTPFSRVTRPDVKSAGKNLGVSLGSLIATKAIVPYLVLFPLAPTIVTLTGVGAGIYFGVATARRVGALRKSSVVQEYVRQRERRWVEKKARPRLTARLGAALRKTFGKTSLLLLKAAKFAGYGLAGAGAVAAGMGGLHYAGVSLVPAAALGAVSLPLAMGLAAAAIPVGLGVGIACRNVARMLESRAASEKKPAFFRRPLPAAEGSAPLPGKTLAGSFKAGTTPPAEMSEERRRAAEARAATRKAGRKF